MQDLAAISVRHAVTDDLAAIKTIAGANRRELGFLPLSKLADAVGRHNLLVAETVEGVIGFVVYRHRKTDSQTTLYDICVDQNWRQQGAGRKLLQTLQMECIHFKRSVLQLKCPEDLAANTFYKHMGFICVETEQGKARKLNIWQKEIARKPKSP